MKNFKFVLYEQRSKVVSITGTCPRKALETLKKNLPQHIKSLNDPRHVIYRELLPGRL